MAMNVDVLIDAIIKYDLSNMKELYLLRECRPELNLPSDTNLLKLSPAEFELVNDYMRGNRQELCELWGPDSMAFMNHQTMMNHFRDQMATKKQPFKITLEMMSKVDKRIAEIKAGD